MSGLISASTFLGLRAAEWAAFGAVVGGFATLGLLIFAARQLRGTIALGRENQELQRELLQAQTRPYVVANLESRGTVAILSISNIGASAAYDVRVALDSRFETAAVEKDHVESWQASALFNDGLPMMAPTFKLRFLLDSLPKRRKTDLPPTIAGSISYRGTAGNEFRDERFVLDLEAVGEALQADKSVHDLVTEIEKFGQTVADFGKNGRGLRVNNVNHDRASNREIRPMHFAKAAKARAENGYRGWAGYWITEWRRRLGLHEW